MFFKFLFDRSTSFFGIVLLSPILIVISILIRVKMPSGSIIFKQKRI